MRGRPVRTLFFGSGSFAVPILDALDRAKEIRLVGVVTAPDRPSGRRAELTPTPVARRARQLDVPILQPERVRAPDAIDAIAALKPDLGVLADYGQIIPPALLEIPPHGILNVHPSLLPRHRGATPIQATIAAGDPAAGVTVMLMDEGLDTGPIVAQEEWMLEGTERAPDLEAEAARRGADLLLRSLKPWLTGETRARRPSDGASIPHAPVPARGCPARLVASRGRTRTAGARQRAVAWSVHRDRAWPPRDHRGRSGRVGARRLAWPYRAPRRSSRARHRRRSACP